MNFSKKQLCIYLVSSVCFICSMTVSAESTILTAAGHTIIGSKNYGFPLLVTSMDNGTHWIEKKPKGGKTKKYGLFKNINCTGKSTTDVCVTVGKNWEENFENEMPMLAVSADGGSNWTFKNIAKSPKGFLNAASCIQYGTAVHCMAVGTKEVDRTHSAALFVESHDNGNTWATKEITELPEGTDRINRISCSGSGTTAVCAIIGRDAKNHLPVLMTSRNGGDTWVNQVLVNYDYFYKDTSCTGEGSNAICMVVGASNVDSIPFLAVSYDGTKTWVEKTATNMPQVGEFYSSTCTGSGSTAICAALGYEIGSQYSTLIVSTDGGKNWITKKIDLISWGSPFSVSCTGEGKTAACVAVFQRFDNSTIFVTSNDGARTWIPKTLPGLSTGAYLSSSSCSGNGLTAICVAGGHE